MKIAPCYDVANKRDCPDRQWCKTVGRSKCSKWVDYERMYRAELEEINKQKQISQASSSAARLRRDKFLKKYSHGKIRIGEF